MKKLKTLLAVAALAVAGTASAQENNYVFNPHWFLQAQVGGAYTVGEAKFTDLISPTAQIAAGYQFTPVWALRLAVGGWQSKGGWGESSAKGFGLTSNTYKWNYIAPALDVKFNLVNAIAGFNPKRVFGLNIIAGVAANIAFNHGEMEDIYNYNNALLTHYPAIEGTSVKPVGRFGLDLDFRCSDRVSVNLEGNANVMSDHYNGKHAKNADWYFNALAGVKIALGKTYKQVEEKWETRIDTTWYDDVTYKESTPKAAEIDKRIFFLIRESDVQSTDAQIDAVANFLRDAITAEITITAYADKGTGNPRVNMKYSQQRAEKTKDALIARGVAPSLIKTVEWKGDTVQPYPDDNDKNRVCIITGHGTFKSQEKVVTKKFRTTENRVRVENTK